VKTTSNNQHTNPKSKPSKSFNDFKDGLGNHNLVRFVTTLAARVPYGPTTPFQEIFVFTFYGKGRVRK